MPTSDPPLGRTLTAPDSPGRPVEARTENRIGRYVLVEELGAGGIGVVIKAYDPKLDRAIALKLLHRSNLDDDARARFEREAQAIARLRHTNVVTVYDVGEHDGEPYLAMELIRGGSLAGWLSAERRSTPDILRVFRLAAHGLIAAHDQGIVHRDFKPANVLLDEDGSVKVADFGLARSVGAVEPPSSQETSESPSLELTLTRTGTVLGTPAYMAPEQLAGSAVDARADQYSFCVSLYEALVGARPEPDAGLTFPAGRVPLRLQRALRRGLASNPAARFGSMHDLVAAMSSSGRRTSVIAAVGALAVTAAAVSYGAYTDRPAACANLGEQIERLWTAETRAAIAPPFTEGHPQGPQIAERLVATVDRAVAAWTRERTNACLATTRGEQSSDMLDRRMLCYERQLTTLTAYVDAWKSGPDVSGIENSVSRFEAAFDLAECGADRLLAAPEQPTTPEAKAVMQLVDRARAQRLLRHRERTIELAEEAVAAARALGADAILAEALFQQAQALQSMQRDEQSLEPLHEATGAASRAGHQRLLILVIGDLAFTLAEKLGRVDEGVRLGRVAFAMSLAFPDDLELRARVSADLGLALQRAARLDESETYLRIALDAQRQLDRPYDLFQALNGVGNTLRDRGKLNEAEPLFVEAVELIERLEGRSTRFSRAALNNLASVYSERGERARAIPIYHRIAEEELAAFGPRSAELFFPYANLALDYLATEQPDRALEHALEVIALYEGLQRTEHPFLARGCIYAARAHLERGEPQPALDYLERAQRIVLAANGEPTTDVTDTYEYQGVALLQQGDVRRARRAFETALALHDARNSDDWERIRARFGMATVLWETGDRDEALALARRARDDLRNTEVDFGPLPKRIDAWLAERA